MVPAPLNDLSPNTPSSQRDDLPTVYMIDKLHPEAVKYCQERFHTILPDNPEASNWRQNAEYLLVRGSYVTAEDIKRSTKLKAIAKQGVGVDKIDVEACERQGIRVFNTPGINARAVAEMVVALATSIAREVTSIHHRQLMGELVPKETCAGLVLHRKTLGVLGMGNIGKTVAKIFLGGFETEIIAYDPFLPDNTWVDIPHKRASTVNEVLRASDILTIHVPLTPETRGMISYAQFSIMKPTAILINAARGGIVSEKDLAKALSEKLIWGAGIDCHEQEPPSKEKYSALWEQNVASTPHIGATTDQTQMEMAKAAVQKLSDFALTQ